jgi:hypothetical protein
MSEHCAQVYKRPTQTSKLLHTQQKHQLKSIHGGTFGCTTFRMTCSYNNMIPWRPRNKSVNAQLTNLQEAYLGEKQAFTPSHQAVHAK